LSWQNLVSEAMKSSPCSNATANVRPVFSSLVFISALGSCAVVRVLLGDAACGRESLLDAGGAGSAGDEQVHQQAGLHRG
jgi:hypothetical protein